MRLSNQTSFERLVTRSRNREWRARTLALLESGLWVSAGLLFVLGAVHVAGVGRQMQLPAFLSALPVLIALAYGVMRYRPSPHGAAVAADRTFGTRELFVTAYEQLRLPETRRKGASAYLIRQSELAAQKFIDAWPRNLNSGFKGRRLALFGLFVAAGLMIQSPQAQDLKLSDAEKDGTSATDRELGPEVEARPTDKLRRELKRLRARETGASEPMRARGSENSDRRDRGPSRFDPAPDATRKRMASSDTPGGGRAADRSYSVGEGSDVSRAGAPSGESGSQTGLGQTSAVGNDPAEGLQQKRPALSSIGITEAPNIRNVGIARPIGRSAGDTGRSLPTEGIRADLPDPAGIRAAPPSRFPQSPHEIWFSPKELIYAEHYLSRLGSER